MGRRQGRWLARAAGMALQVMGAVLYLGATGAAAQGRWPFANPAFLGAAMLAGAAFAIAWWSRLPLDAQQQPTRAAAGFASTTRRVSSSRRIASRACSNTAVNSAACGPGFGVGPFGVLLDIRHPCERGAGDGPMGSAAGAPGRVGSLTRSIRIV